MRSVLKLISIFTKQERRRLALITVLILFSSILGIVEVGSLGPFMAVAADPGIVHRQHQLAYLYQVGGFQERSDGDTAFLIFLGIAVFISIFVITAFKTGVLYIVHHFTGNRRYTLSVRLFRRYLFQPYLFFLNRNTGELSKNLLSEVDIAINSVLAPAINALISGLIVLAVLVFLVILNPLVAVFATGVFGFLYLGIYAFIRPRLTSHGKVLRDANLSRYKVSAEAFGGIKDLKILGKESFFVDAYSRGARRFTSSQTAHYVLSTLPAQVMQSMAIGFAIVLMIILLMINHSLADILPLMAIYAFAVMRIMPNLQHFFYAMATMRYSAYAVNALLKDMNSLASPPSSLCKKTGDTVLNPLPFTQNIEIKNIMFFYPASRKPVLKGIDVSIPKNTTIAFAGTTGCGKTTLVDVIMGLLEPASGSIAVDGAPVIGSGETETGGKLLSSWQRNFGYVPQYIFLSDDTVAANIAFGIPEKLRNASAMEQAAKIANLHEFITRELPKGYNTVIGERGIRLSGGQCQRVGIARALYHDPNILVMDEATSALDSVTEEAVMDAIHNLMHSKTMIIIAHRLSTIQECDVIYLMEAGRIIAQGTYNELLADNLRFRTMAKVDKQ